MKMIFEKDFADLIKIFQKYEVRFVLVGGLAVVFHGHFRTTKDMDLFYEPSIDNAKKMQTAIREFGFGYLKLSVEDIVDKNGYIKLGNEPSRIDLLCDLPGIQFDEVYESAVIYSEEDLEIKVIDINKLIRNKKAVGRTQDLDDVKKLEKILKRNAK